MKDEKESFIAFLLGFILAPFIILLIVVNSAYPAMMVWNMFVPDYFGLPMLTLPYAVLTITVIFMFKGNKVHRTEDTRSGKTKANDLLIHFISPWFSYAIALITYNFFVV